MQITKEIVVGMNQKTGPECVCVCVSTVHKYTVQWRCLYLSAPHGRSKIFLECSTKLCERLALQCVNCTAVK